MYASGEGKLLPERDNYFLFLPLFRLQFALTEV